MKGGHVFFKRIIFLYNKKIILIILFLLMILFVFDFFYRPTYQYAVDFSNGETMWDVKIDKFCSYNVLLHFNDTPELQG